MDANQTLLGSAACGQNYCHASNTPAEQSNTLPTFSPLQVWSPDLQSCESATSYKPLKEPNFSPSALGPEMNLTSLFLETSDPFKGCESYIGNERASECALEHKQDFREKRDRAISRKHKTVSRGAHELASRTLFLGQRLAVLEQRHRLDAEQIASQNETASVLEQENDQLRRECVRLQMQLSQILLRDSRAYCDEVEEVPLLPYAAYLDLNL